MVCLLLLIPALSKTQDVHLFSVEPTISLGGNIKHGLDYFFQTASESRLTEGDIKGVSFTDGVKHIEATAGLACDLSTELSGTASFTFRKNTPFDENITTELRPTQHLTYATSFGKYRIRQRLRADERFQQRGHNRKYKFDLRLSYRLALDFPLEGDRLDNREFYLNTNAEFLYTPTTTDAFFYREWNGYAGLGYKLNDLYTLELGGVLKTARISRDLGRVNKWLVKVVWVVSI